jgi:hypothetical protein
MNSSNRIERLALCRDDEMCFRLPPPPQNGKILDAEQKIRNDTRISLCDLYRQIDIRCTDWLLYCCTFVLINVVLLYYCIAEGRKNPINDVTREIRIRSERSKSCTVWTTRDTLATNPIRLPDASQSKGPSLVGWDCYHQTRRTMATDLNSSMFTHWTDLLDTWFDSRRIGWLLFSSKNNKQHVPASSTNNKNPPAAARRRRRQARRYETRRSSY